MAIASVYDSSEEVRLTCLDQLQTKKRPEVISYYVGKLRDKNNEIVNLAAAAIGRMKDPSAIGPLIDALVTLHKFKIQQAGGPNSTSGSFGVGPGGRPGGAGLSAGTKPTTITSKSPEPGRSRRPGRYYRVQFQLRQAGVVALV